MPQSGTIENDEHYGLNRNPAKNISNGEPHCVRVSAPRNNRKLRKVRCDCEKDRASHPFAPTNVRIDCVGAVRQNVSGPPNHCAGSCKNCEYRPHRQAAHLRFVPNIAWYNPRMRYVQLSEATTRTFALAFEIGDEVLRDMMAFLISEEISTASFTAIGGFERATVAYFDWQKKEYEKIPIDEQVETLSLVGNVTRLNGQPLIHAHCVLGHRDGHTTGGHLLEGHVCPTIELFLNEVPAQIHKTMRPEINLALMDVTKTQVYE